MKMNIYVLSDVMNFTFFKETGLRHETEYPFRDRVCSAIKEIHYLFDLNAVLRRATRSYSETAPLFILPVIL
jgi:hypothetical protein